MVDAAGTVTQLCGKGQDPMIGDKNPHGWHKVLLASCRKPFEHLGISDDVASHSLGSMYQVDNIKISVQFTNLCQHIGKVFREFKQGIVCTLASCLTPSCSSLDLYNCASSV